MILRKETCNNISSEKIPNPVVYFRGSKKFKVSDEMGTDCNIKILQALIKGNETGEKPWEFIWEKAVKPLEPYYQVMDPNDNTLAFESRFECGNLDLAIKIDDNNYKLVMQSDSNTKGNTQWFYFKVSNTKQGLPVNFEIMNYVCHIISANHIPCLPKG